MKTPTGTFKDFATDTAIKRPELSLLDQAKNFGLEGLSKGSELLRPGGEIPNLFSKAGLKAATLPATTATGDVMQAEARRLEKQSIIDAALDEAAALGDTAASALAIRNAMEAYGFFSEDEILSTIESAGYADGGRVGFDNGGLSNLLRGMQGRKGEETEENFLTIDGGEGIKLFMLDDIDKPIIRKSYSKEDSGRRNEAFFEIINPETGAISTISQEDYFAQYGEPKAKGGRVGYRFGGIDKAIEGVSEEIQEEGKEGIMMAAKEDPMLVEEYNKYVFDLLEQRPDAKPMSFKDFKRMIKSGMKDGGR
jgi:uncharacterized short protein YbdD (DUF466 family)